MLTEVKPYPLPGLVKLNSPHALKLYLKELMDYYEREADVYGEKVGRLMRSIDGQLAKWPKLKEVKWSKAGMVLLNTNEPARGTLELLIEAMEDYKVKAKRTAEVLQSVNDLEDAGIPENASILVYLRHGVPLRILIDKERNADVDGLIAPGRPGLVRD